MKLLREAPASRLTSAGAMLVSSWMRETRMDGDVDPVVPNPLLAETPPDAATPAPSADDPPDGATGSFLTPQPPSIAAPAMTSSGKKIRLDRMVMSSPLAVRRRLLPRQRS
ncbi:hypothetical protein VQ042_20275 [Aurantimonas sp. A2-1-M11]|uniref:hypothetical protein n=1 Tax=Aurantimonas sp. A2-1-M11 TaxID=3113712 RepID=UPI002F92EC1D